MGSFRRFLGRGGSPNVSLDGIDAECQSFSWAQNIRPPPKWADSAMGRSFWSW